MGFAKVEKKVKEKFAEKDYLNAIGVTYISGEPLDDIMTWITVDRERNYFLILRGSTNLNRDNKKILYYALCLNGEVVNMEVEKYIKGKFSDSSRELHWEITKLTFPKGWTFDVINEEELRKIINEAFTTESYTSVFTPERTKDVTIDIVAPVEV